MRHGLYNFLAVLVFILLSLWAIGLSIKHYFFHYRFGRKPTVVYSFLSSGVACIVVAFIPTEGGKQNRSFFIRALRSILFVFSFAKFLCQEKM